MQRRIVDLAGRAVGWAAAVMAICLAGFGVSLGRFDRFNSWDLFSKPHVLLPDIADRLLDPLQYPKSTAATVLLSAFLLLAYLSITALMRLGAAGAEPSARGRAGPLPA